MIETVIINRCQHLQIKHRCFIHETLRSYSQLISIIHRSTAQVHYFWGLFVVSMQKANKSNNQNERIASTELGTIRMDNKEWYYDGGKKWKALKYITITLE